MDNPLSYFLKINKTHLLELDESEVSCLETEIIEDIGTLNH